MRISSLFISILLHLAVLAFILYVPLRPPLDITRPIYQVSLVMGAPGGKTCLLPYWEPVHPLQVSRSSLQRLLLNPRLRPLPLRSLKRRRFPPPKLWKKNRLLLRRPDQSPSLSPTRTPYRYRRSQPPSLKKNRHRNRKKSLIRNRKKNLLRSRKVILLPKQKKNRKSLQKTAVKTPWPMPWPMCEGRPVPSIQAKAEGRPHRAPWPTWKNRSGAQV